MIALPVGIFLAVVGIRKVKRFTDRFGCTRTDVAHGARITESVRNLLHQVFPLGLRHLAEGRAHQDLALSASRVLNFGFERTVIAELAIDFEGLTTGERWVGGRGD